MIPVPGPASGSSGSQAASISHPETASIAAMVPVWQCWLMWGRPMTDDERLEWEAYRAEPTTERRNKLVERYRYLAKRLAGNSLAKMRGLSGQALVDFDDLFQIACIGLMSAITRFDPSRGYEPSTYLAWRIIGSVSDYLSEIDPMPKKVRRLAKEIRRVEEVEIGRQLEPDEVRERFGHERPIELRVRSMESLTADGEKLADLMAFSTRDPDETTSLDDMRQLLRGLKQRERLLVVMRFVLGYELKRCGLELCVSESRIHQLLTEIYGKIRRRIERGDVVLA